MPTGTQGETLTMVAERDEQKKRGRGTGDGRLVRKQRYSELRFSWGRRGNVLKKRMWRGRRSCISTTEKFFHGFKKKEV